MYLKLWGPVVLSPGLYEVNNRIPLPLKTGNHIGLTVFTSWDPGLVVLQYVTFTFTQDNLTRLIHEYVVAVEKVLCIRTESTINMAIALSCHTLQTSTNIHIVTVFSRQKKFPFFVEICSRKDITSARVNLKQTEFKGKKFKLNSAYCDKSKLKYNLPAAVMNSKEAYDLFHWQRNKSSPFTGLLLWIGIKKRS